MFDVGWSIFYYLGYLPVNAQIVEFIFFKDNCFTGNSFKVCFVNTAVCFRSIKCGIVVKENKRVSNLQKKRAMLNWTNVLNYL